MEIVHKSGAKKAHWLKLTKSKIASVHFVENL